MLHLKNNRFLLIAFLFFYLIFLSGCGNNRELNRQLILQGIAIDKTESDYIITVQAFDFKNPANEDQPSTKIIETHGSTVLEALENIGKKTGLTPVYSQNMIILIGEDVAKIGINNFMDFFIRHCEMRPKVKLCVCKGRALDLIKIKTSGNDVIKAQDISDLIPDMLNSDVLHVMGNIYGEISDPCMALLEKVKNDSSDEILFKGVGVFKEDSLVDFIEGDDAFGFMILKGVPKFGAQVLSTEYLGNVTCSADKITVDVSPEISENEYPIFNINLNIESSAFAFDNKQTIGEKEQDVNELNKDFEQKLEPVFKNVIKKLSELNCDVLDYAKILKNKYPQYFKNTAGGFKSIMQKCEYNINQNVSIKVTGKEPI